MIDVTVSITEETWAALEEAAARAGITTTDLVRLAAIEKADGAISAEEFFRARRGKGDSEWAKAFLSREGGAEPEPWDRID